MVVCVFEALCTHRGPLGIPGEDCVCGHTFQRVHYMFRRRHPRKADHGAEDREMHSGPPPGPQQGPGQPGVRHGLRLGSRQISP